MPSRRLSAALGTATLVLGTALGALVSAQAPVLASSPAAPVLVLQEAPAAAPAPAVPAAPAQGAPAVTPAPAAEEAAAAAAGPAAAAAPAADGAEPEPAGAPVAAPVPAPAVAPAPAAHHVWVVSLTGQDAATAFAPDSAAPYLARDLRPLGTLLDRYVPLPGGIRANGAALVAGLAPDPASTEAFAPEVGTVAGQLAAGGRSWRAYVEGQAAPCDAAFGPRDPFVLFRSVTEAPDCAARVVGLEQLDADLADAARTPALSWIVPGPGHDGADAAGGPEAPAAPAGLAGADAFLRDVVPRIVASAAFADAGLLVIAFDAPAPAADPAAPPAPVGVLLLSPLVARGATAATPTGPHGLLRGLEDLLGLPRLGHAADPKVAGFAPTVFTPTINP